MPNCILCNGSGDLGNPDALKICEMSTEQPCAPCQEYIHLDIQINAMKASLSRLLERQRDLSTDLNRCHDPVTRRLPLEIVFSIFEYYAADCVPEPEDNEEEFEEDGDGRWEVYKTNCSPLTLGAVCQSWRQISWSEPRLWTYVGVSVGLPYDWNRLEILQQWIDRSHQLPLSIYLSMHQPDPLLEVDPREAFSRVISLINQQSSRWKNMRISCSPVLLPLIKGDGRGAPLLKSLVISVPEPSDIYLVLGEVAPYSTSFSLAGVKSRPKYFQSYNISFQSFSVDWSQVTKVSFSSFPPVYLNQILELLQQAPQLIECCLHHVNDDPDLLPAQLQHINRSKLNHGLKSLTFGRYPGNRLKIFLSFLSLPQLTHLSLETITSTDLKHFADWISRSARRILSLKLYSVFYDDDEILELLQSTTFLQELEIICCDSMNGSFLLSRSPTTNATPTVSNSPPTVLLSNLRYLRYSHPEFNWCPKFWVHISKLVVRWPSLQRIKLDSQWEMGPRSIDDPPLCPDAGIVSRLIEASKRGVDIELTWNKKDLLQGSVSHHNLSWND